MPVSEFRLESGLPVWRYEVDGFVLEKRLLMPYRQNTVHISYRLLAGEGTLRLGLRPAIHFRHHDAPVSTGVRHPYRLTVSDGQFEITADPRISHAAPAHRRAVRGLHFRGQGNRHDPLPHGAPSRL